MNTKQIVTNILVLAIGVFGSLMAFYQFIKADIQSFLTQKSQEQKDEQSVYLGQLRLAALERAILFIDRINPANLFTRLHQPGIGLRELQNLSNLEVKAEFQHNITQQLYLSNESWNVIKQLKDDTITMINHVSAGLPEGANGIDLSRMILQHLATLSDNPYDLAINHVKKEINQIFKSKH